MKKILSIIATVAVITTAVFGGTAFAKEKLVVGAKNFTEQYIVGEMMTDMLKENGFSVKKRMGTGSSVTRQALETGQIDMYPEYTGTAWLLYLKQKEVITDPVALYGKVKELDLEENGIVWLDMAPLNNTYALTIRKDDVSKLGSTISEVTELVNEGKQKIVFGLDQEFFERPDGLPALSKTYGMKVNKNEFKRMDIGLTFEAISRGQIDVAMVFATDGKIPKFGLTLLKDDKHFFPVYNLCPTIRKEVLDKHPEIKDIFAPLFAVLDDDTMQKLNYEVDVNGKPAEMVAEEFLKSRGFIK